MFEDRNAAKAYAKANGIKTGWFRSNKIRKQDDGSYAIENKEEGSVTFEHTDSDGDKSVISGALFVERGIHVSDVGQAKVDSYSNPLSDSYNPNAVIFQDWGDFAYQLGHTFTWASPSARLATAAKLSSTEKARRLGTAGERAAGIPANAAKTRIPSATGTAAYRVPDQLTATLLIEVKNVAKQSLTNQLRDMLIYAQATNRQMILRTRPSTTFTQPLQNLIDQGQIIVQPLILP